MTVAARAAVVRVVATAAMGLEAVVRAARLGAEVVEHELAHRNRVDASGPVREEQHAHVLHPPLAAAAFGMHHGRELAFHLRVRGEFR